MDTLDEDSDALDTLQGKLYPLKLGYVGVVCRNQKDLNAKKSVKESLDAERVISRTMIVLFIDLSGCRSSSKSIEHISSTPIEWVSLTSQTR